MTTEIVSSELDKPVLIEKGYFYAINKVGQITRFKPGRKKKEAQEQTAASEVQAGGVPT